MKMALISNSKELHDLITSTMQYPMLFPISIFLFISLIILFTRFRSRTQFNLPPSPPRLPLIGNLHLLGTHPHRSLRTLSCKYGPLMLLQMGQVPTLVVSSSEMVKEIVKKHDVVFSDRPKTSAADIFCYGGQDVGFAPYGEYWRQARKICVLELLSHKRVQQFHFVRKEETDVLVNRIIRKGCCINLSEMLVATSNNIVSRCILGQSFEEENGRSKFGELTRKVMEDFEAFSFGDFFPSKYLSWLDVVTGFTGRLTRRFRALDTFLEQVVEEHKKVLNYNSEFGRKDFAGILLGLQRDGLLDFDLTRENIKGILMDMFVGASDTTSATMEWLMAELVKNPRVMKKVQEEIRRVVGNKSEIDMNDINQMDYLKCVIKENLRLHPPLPFLLPRKTLSSRVKLGGYDIHGKTRVLINVFAIQRDPNEWDKAEEFLPERFENNTIDFKMGQDFQFVPFGIGRRGCPAVSFGTVIVEYVIAHLLYWFDWELVGGDDDGSAILDMSEDYGITVHKRTSLQLVPIPYSP